MRGGGGGNSERGGDHESRFVVSEKWNTAGTEE